MPENNQPERERKGYQLFPFKKVLEIHEELKKLSYRQAFNIAVNILPDVEEIISPFFENMKPKDISGGNLIER